MRRLIEYIRSCFCKHEFELVSRANIYRTQYDSMPYQEEYSYMCEKCGYIKKIKL